MSFHGNGVQDCAVDEAGRYINDAVDERLRGKKVGKDADEAGMESSILTCTVGRVVRVCYLVVN